MPPRTRKKSAAAKSVQERGQSSRPPPRAPPAQPPPGYDPDTSSDDEGDNIAQFTSPQNARWYTERQANNIIVERSAQAGVSTAFGIRAAFMVLGWLSAIIDLKGVYYPELVKQFYANVKNKGGSRGEPRVFIRSKVKGKHILIDEALLNRHLGLPGVGPDLHFAHGNPSGEPGWSKHAAMERLNAPISRTGRDQEVIGTKHLPINARLIAYLLASNVEPKASGLNELRISDLYIIDKMLYGLQGIEGIPLAPIIIGSMWDVVKHKTNKKNFCFPILISQLLVARGVSVDGEVQLRTDASTVLNPSVMVQMGFQLRPEGWRNPERTSFEGIRLEAPAPGQAPVDEVQAELDEADQEAPAQPQAQAQGGEDQRDVRSVGQQLRLFRAEVQQSIQGCHTRMERMDTRMDRMEGTLDQMLHLLHSLAPPQPPPEQQPPPEL